MLFILVCSCIASVFGQVNDNEENIFALEPADINFGEFRVIATNNRAQGPGLFQRLSLTSQVRVYPKSYVALLHKSGATIELYKAGLYTVKWLKAQLLAYAQTYPKYPINLKINDPNKRSYKHTYYHYWAMRCPEAPISVLLPLKSKVLYRKLRFSWYDKKYSTSHPTSYEVTVTDLMDAELTKMKSSQNQVTVNLSQTGIDCACHIIRVRALDSHRQEGCEASMVEYVNNQSIKTTYQQFKLKNQQTKSPLVATFNEMLFWNRRTFYLEVDRLWQNLVKKYPSHPVLAAAYQHFRVVTNLKRGTGVRKK